MSPKIKSPVSFSRASNGGKEGNISQTWEGEHRDDLAGETDCVDYHKYGDNPFE